MAKLEPSQGSSSRKHRYVSEALVQLLLLRSSLIPQERIRKHKEGKNCFRILGGAGIRGFHRDDSVYGLEWYFDLISSLSVIS